MVLEDIKTVAGKAPTLTVSFRLTIADYLRAVELCKQQQISLAKATELLWLEQLNNPQLNKITQS